MFSKLSASGHKSSELIVMGCFQYEIGLFSSARIQTVLFQLALLLLCVRSSGSIVTDPFATLPYVTMTSVTFESKCG